MDLKHKNNVIVIFFTPQWCRGCGLVARRKSFPVGWNRNLLVDGANMTGTREQVFTCASYDGHLNGLNSV